MAIRAPDGANKAKQAWKSIKIVSQMIIIQPFSSSSWAERELVLRWPALGILSGGSSHADPVVQTIPGGLRYHVQSSQIIYPSLPVENPPNISEYQYLRLIFRQQIFVFVGVDTWHTCDRVWQYLLGIVLSSGGRWCLVSNYNHCLVSPTSCSSANADCCHQRLQRQPATYVRDRRNSAI